MHKNWIFSHIAVPPSNPRIGSGQACIVIEILYYLDPIQPQRKRKKSTSTEMGGGRKVTRACAGKETGKDLNEYGCMGDVILYVLIFSDTV